MPMEKRFRAMWDKAGYGTQMGSAEVCAPPPKSILRVYHLTSAEYAISNISLGRLKVARFSDLNDPFELMSLSLNGKLTRRAISEFKNTYGSQTGLLSFSANWTSPVMWSHYAAKHRGVCLGFNLKRSLAQKVDYSDKRIAELDKNGNAPELTKKLQKLLIRTKSSHWSYEQEHRVFVPLEDATQEGKLHFRLFDKDLQLVEVILGPSCDLTLNAVRQLTEALQPQAIAFRSRLAFKSFNIVPKESTVP